MKIIKVFLTIIIIISAKSSYSSETLTYEKFINSEEFVAIDSQKLNLHYSSCKTYKKNGKVSYKEIKLLLDKNEVLHINEHHDFLNDYQSKNYTKPFYSISMWAWYQTVAFKTKNSDYFSNYIQSVKRRNMIVPKQLISDILSYNEFRVYLHQDKQSNNKKYFGDFSIGNNFEPKKCFNNSIYKSHSNPLLSSFSDLVICEKATLFTLLPLTMEKLKVWKGDKKEYIAEAKHRGLSCGIDEKKYHTFVSYWKNKEKENLKKQEIDNEMKSLSKDYLTKMGDKMICKKVKEMFVSYILNKNLNNENYFTEAKRRNLDCVVKINKNSKND